MNTFLIRRFYHRYYNKCRRTAPVSFGGGGGGGGRLRSIVSPVIARKSVYCPTNNNYFACLPEKLYFKNARGMKPPSPLRPSRTHMVVFHSITQKSITFKKCSMFIGTPIQTIYFMVIRTWNEDMTITSLMTLYDCLRMIMTQMRRSTS